MNNNLLNTSRSKRVKMANGRSKRSFEENRNTFPKVKKRLGRIILKWSWLF